MQVNNMFSIDIKNPIDIGRLNLLKKQVKETNKEFEDAKLDFHYHVKVKENKITNKHDVSVIKIYV